MDMRHPYSPRNTAMNKENAQFAQTNYSQADQHAESSDC